MKLPSIRYWNVSQTFFSVTAEFDQVSQTVEATTRTPQIRFKYGFPQKIAKLCGLSVSYFVLGYRLFESYSACSYLKRLNLKGTKVHSLDLRERLRINQQQVAGQLIINNRP